VKSDNSQIFQVIDKIFAHLGHRGIHAIDRGAIYGKYPGEEKAKRLVIRFDNRNLLHRRRRKNCVDLARSLPTPYETVLVVYEEGQERKRTVQYNAIADGIFNLPFPDNTALRGIKPKNLDDFQLTFDFR